MRTAGGITTVRAQTAQLILRPPNSSECPPKRPKTLQLSSNYHVFISLHIIKAKLPPSLTSSRRPFVR